MRLFLAIIFLLMSITTSYAEDNTPCSSFDACMKMAEEGNAHAQSLIGFAYLTGFNNIEQNDERSFYWFKKAAENGSPKGQEFYGAYLIYDINSTAADKKEGVEWVTKSAHQENEEAQYTLGMIYKEGLGHYDIESKESEEIIKVDDEKAFKWLSRAAEKQIDKAQYNLAKMYLNGHGVEQNEEIAKDFLKKAAAQGHKDAEFLLKMYSEIQ